QSLTLVACGLAIGVPAAMLLTRSMTSLVYGLSPGDIPTIAAAVAALATVAAGAAMIPARRAASVDPMIALRVEYRLPPARVFIFVGRSQVTQQATHAGPSLRVADAT